MVDIRTKYMGFVLSNPLIVASSSLTKSLDGVKRCADAGAGAVVLKSLFEEQINVEVKDVEQYILPYWHPEAFDYVRQMGMELGPTDYLHFVSQTKEALSIPVIASLNCISPKWWINYVKRIVDAGADAIELNIAMMPSNPLKQARAIEHLYLEIIEEVDASIDIPIAVKIGPYFTSMAHMANQLSKHDVSALVLFNRFYQPNIDIEKLAISPGYNFSSPEEMGQSLRWIALLSGKLDCDLAAATGIHDASGVIKQILAGAKVAQLCSTLYLNGLKQIGVILEDIRSWMAKHSFQTLDDFRGKLSQMESKDPEVYERIQYIKSLVGTE